MIGQLLGPVANLAGTWLSGKVEEKAAQNKVKVAKAEAEAQIMISAATSEAEWDRIMANASANSWKDEWLTILFSIPLILAFCGDWGRGNVSEGFAALDAMPSYYQYTLGVIVSASFGVRAATKFFGKK